MQLVCIEVQDVRVRYPSTRAITCMHRRLNKCRRKDVAGEEHPYPGFSTTSSWFYSQRFSTFLYATMRFSSFASLSAGVLALCQMTMGCRSSFTLVLESLFTNGLDSQLPSVRLLSLRSSLSVLSLKIMRSTVSATNLCPSIAAVSNRQWQRS